MKEMHVAPAGKLKDNFIVKAERVRNLTPTEFAHWMWGDPDILEKIEECRRTLVTLVMS